MYMQVEMCSKKDPKYGKCATLSWFWNVKFSQACLQPSFYGSPWQQGCHQHISSHVAHATEQSSSVKKLGAHCNFYQKHLFLVQFCCVHSRTCSSCAFLAYGCRNSRLITAWITVGTEIWASEVVLGFLASGKPSAFQSTAVKWRLCIRLCTGDSTSKLGDDRASSVWRLSAFDRGEIKMWEGAWFVVSHIFCFCSVQRGRSPNAAGSIVPLLVQSRVEPRT